MSQFPNVRFLLSVASADQFPPEQGSEVAFAGRSNAGKSSAINAITGRSGLARISKTPGRTKLLNFFELEPGARIIDLPGYGYAEASPAEKRQWTQLIDSLPERASLAGLFLVVDIRRGIGEPDLQLVDWATAAGWAIHVLLTKSDKLNQRDGANSLKEAESACGSRASVQVFSAHDRTGVQAAQKRLKEMLGK